MCQYGQGIVRGLLEEFPGESLRCLVIWVSMMGGDDEPAAQIAASAFEDDRIEHVWDGQRTVASFFGEALGLQCPAWDVYLLYGSDVVWDGGAPPEPTFWMLQLPEQVGADPKQLLNPGRIGEALGELLNYGPKQPDLGLRLHAKALSAVRGARTSHSPECD